jgi:REP element-mobilizing transposase RayT
MPYDSFKHHRKSIRLPGYDYSSPGAYFITIATHQRQILFGGINDGIVQLNAPGTIISEYWSAIPIHFPNVELDEFVIMPDHIHGIIVIHKNDRSVRTVGARLPRPESPENELPIARSPRPESPENELPIARSPRPKTGRRGRDYPAPTNPNNHFRIQHNMRLHWVKSWHSINTNQPNASIKSMAYPVRRCGNAIMEPVPSACPPSDERR